MDPDYFQKQYLADERLVTSFRDRFQNFADLGINVDASAFYPAIEGYYNEGDLPFIRVADVDGFIDSEDCIRIPKELCDRLPTLRRVTQGDIVFTKGGSVARIGLVLEDMAASRDLIFLNSSRLSKEEQSFLYSYFLTDFFNRQLVRSSSQTAQPHLTITLVRNLPIAVGSQRLKECCRDLISASYAARATAIARHNEAQRMLLAGLDLQGWKAPDVLSYERRASEVFAASRLDAEFFSPAYETLFEIIRHHGAIRLGDSLREPVRRGISPEYFEDGDTLVINSQHVGKTEIRLNDNRYTRRSAVVVGFGRGRSGVVQKGDVLLNSTGRITIGRSQCVLEDTTAVVDNHIAIIRPTKRLDPVFLAAFLNSQAGQMQTERGYTGSSGQIELRPDLVEDYLIWDAPSNIQLTIRDLVEQAHAGHKQSRFLLNRAKRAVEIAIEQSGDTALAFLEGTSE